eukprot:TRINITY_DN18543_c0_g1_i1.p1 TRINITY_DN18543_c0_g1~~TRINITY_DN18543_c0_g1_i1.p1  ORF type:complete len:624 (+),score=93.06 TRINITY_DN18543_c0_g1_i1:40-1911(+)
MKNRSKASGKQQKQAQQNHKQTVKQSPAELQLRRWFWVVLLVALVVNINCVVGSEFVFDDHVAIKNNPDVTGASPASNILSNDFWGGDITKKSSHKSYRPITTAIFRLLYTQCGGTPAVFKTLNVILHGINTVLVYILAAKLFNQNHSRVVVSSMLFAIHPIHTEAVASVVGQADLLSCLFALLVVLQSLSSTISVSRCVWMFVLLSMSFLTKETGITAAIPSLFCILVMNKTAARKDQMFPAVVVIVAVVVLVFVRGVVTGWNPVPKGFRKLDNPLPFIEDASDRALTIGRVWLEYIRLLLLPLWLSCDYSFSAIPVVASTPSVVSFVAASVVFLIILFAGIIYWLPSDARRMFLFFALFFASCFSPASHVFVYPGTLVAERLLYLPSIPFCLFIGWVLGPVYHSRTYVKFFCICMAIILSCLTITRNAEWKTQVSLFESALVATPNSAKVQLNIGIARQQANRTTEAMHHLEKAAAIFPEGCQHHYWMGRCYMDELNYEAAVKKMHLAVECTELDHRKHALIALEAIFKKYAQASPKSADAHTNLANIFQLRMNFKDAELLYKHALKLQKGHPAAAINYSRMLLAKERYSEAVDIASIIVSDPTHGRDAEEVIKSASSKMK